ALSSAQ
ncbi:unnamed protein product, partial [Rotaria sp. Silwood1]